MDSFGPTLSPEQAIPLLRRQIERLEKMISLSLPSNDREVEIWFKETIDLLHRVYGKPKNGMHPNTSMFATPDGESAPRTLSTYEKQNWFLASQEKRKALLTSLVGELNELLNLAPVSRPQPTGRPPSEKRADSRIFIGHGRSQDWRVLNDFLVHRLHLLWEEFNRESPAGRSTIARLEEMIENVNFAFIVMTAEDEHSGGTMHARENVIHEAGLFQGRLGFEKAIILREEGCAEFSNIHGLSQIPFPKGNIKACFEEIRQVLEREGILPRDDLKARSRSSST